MACYDRAGEAHDVSVVVSALLVVQGAVVVNVRDEAVYHEGDAVVALDLGALDQKVGLASAQACRHGVVLDVVCGQVHSLALCHLVEEGYAMVRVPYHSPCGLLRLSGVYHLHQVVAHALAARKSAHVQARKRAIACLLSARVFQFRGIVAFRLAQLPGRMTSHCD